MGYNELSPSCVESEFWVTFLSDLNDFKEVFIFTHKVSSSKVISCKVNSSV